MPVKAKIRFDFKADTGKRRFFWQRRDLNKAARELREVKVSLLKSLPFQGLNMTEFDMEHDVYLVQNDEAKTVAFAPVEMLVEADSFQDLTQLTLRTEFRKIKVLEPDNLLLSTNEMERFLFKVNEEFRSETAEDE
jgi:hypothetical protein